MADNDYMFYGAYMDEWKENKSYRVGINSKVQTTNYMELFVAYERNYDGLILQTSGIDSLRTFDKILAVKIDTLTFKNLEWFPSSKANNTIGITTFIPLDSLPNGTHTLTVWSTLKYENQHQEFEVGGYQVKIPFLIDK